MMTDTQKTLLEAMADGGWYTYNELREKTRIEKGLSEAMRLEPQGKKNRYPDSLEGRGLIFCRTRFRDPNAYYEFTISDLGRDALNGN